MLSKKNILFSSFSLSLVFLGTLYYIENVCRSGSFRCSSLYEIVWMVSGIFLPIFISSCILYFIKDEIFYTWKTFTEKYIIVYLLILIISPSITDAYIPISKETMSLLFSVVYFLLSLILIIYKSIKLRGK